MTTEPNDTREYVLSLVDVLADAMTSAASDRSTIRIPVSAAVAALQTPEMQAIREFLKARSYDSQCEFFALPTSVIDWVLASKGEVRSLLNRIDAEVGPLEPADLRWAAEALEIDQ